MRLEEVFFRESVPFKKSDRLRLQARDPKDPGTYAPVLRVADGFVWWSETEAAPLVNVRSVTFAAEPSADVGALDAMPFVVARAEKGKKR